MSVMILLITSYNGIIYTQHSVSNSSPMSEEAILGEELWQKNNCVSCHQLYGLGGYLGPDLTNLTSTPFKEKNYIFSRLEGGVGTMPEFKFTNEEKEQLYTFLDHIDKTGFYPNKETTFDYLGWGKLKYK